MALTRQVGGSEAERELTRAVRRVHDKYGRDLTAFFEDVQKAAKEGQKDSPLKESAQNDRFPSQKP